MTKTEFLSELKKGLSGLPEEDITRSIEFYIEMIDDRIEDGKTEEEALADIGAVKDVVSQILSEIPISKLIKEKVKRRRLGALEIVLLALGSPIWLSLLVAAFAVIISVYAVIWSIVVSFWAVFAAFVGGSLGGIAAGVIFICTGNLLAGLAMIAASFILAGLSVFSFFGCKTATKGTVVVLTKKIALGIKNCFIRKGNAK